MIGYIMLCVLIFILAMILRLLIGFKRINEVTEISHKANNKISEYLQDKIDNDCGYDQSEHQTLLDNIVSFDTLMTNWNFKLNSIR